MKLIKLLFLSIILGSSLFANDSIPLNTLREYTGRYILPENQYAQLVNVELKNDTLFVATEMGPIILSHVIDNQFEVPEFGVKVHFLKDELTLKVLGVRIIYTEGDLDLFGKKEAE